MVELEDLVSDIVKELVPIEDSYDITTEELDGVYTINVDVKKDYIGKVIGKGGKIAKSIRSIVKGYAIKHKIKVFVSINEF